MPCPTGPRLKFISGLTLVTLVLDWFFWFSWNVVWGLDYWEFLRFAPSILLLDDWGFYPARSGSGGGRLVLLLYYWHPGSRREGWLTSRSPPICGLEVLVGRFPHF